MKTSIFIILIIFLTGCTAFKLPAETRSEGTSTNYTSPTLALVSIDQKYEYRQIEFKRALKLANITILESENAPNNESWYIKLNISHGLPCFGEPMLTVMTLGIIPYIGCTEIGYDFDLYDSRMSHIAHVNTKEKVKIVWGWVAIGLIPFKNWHRQMDLDRYEARKLSGAIEESINNIPIKNHKD